MRKAARNIPAYVVFLLLGFQGCSAKPEQHSTTGVIREVQKEGKVLVIQHEEFPGFMEAMTMSFATLDTAIAKGLKPGDKVKFTIAKKGASWPINRIEKINRD